MHPILPLTPDQRRELLRKAEAYERAAATLGPHLAGFAAALRYAARRPDDAAAPRAA